MIASGQMLVKKVIVATATLLGAAGIASASPAGDVIPCGSVGLLPNAGFETSLSPWTTDPSAAWSPVDANGSATSGSVEISVSEFTSKAISYCVPVNGGARYQLGVDVLIDMQGNVQGKAGIVARWQADAECTDSLNEFPGNAFFISAPEWRTQLLTVDVPQSAKGAIIELRATKTGGGGGGTIVANLDNAVFASGGAAECADPVCSFTGSSSSDALYTLRASVGSTTCALCYCDVNGSGDVTAGDALTVLRAAVDIPVELACPACQ
jgi:hypothetical protein